MQVQQCLLLENLIENIFWKAFLPGFWPVGSKCLLGENLIENIFWRAFKGGWAVGRAFLTKKINDLGAFIFTDDECATWIS